MGWQRKSSGMSAQQVLERLQRVQEGPPVVGHGGAPQAHLGNLGGSQQVEALLQPAGARWECHGSSSSSSAQRSKARRGACVYHQQE